MPRSFSINYSAKKQVNIVTVLRTAKYYIGQYFVHIYNKPPLRFLRYYSYYKHVFSFRFVTVNYRFLQFRNKDKIAIIRKYKL